MLIIMCGYPGSGKSTFLDLLCSEINIDVVRPSDWYNGGSSGHHIACWEHGLDKTIGLLRHSDIVALDTCAASSSSINGVIATAMARNHKIMLIFIATNIFICCERVDYEVVQKYKSRIRNAVLDYKALCDYFVIVKNGNIVTWKQRAKQIARRISKNNMVK